MLDLLDLLADFEAQRAYERDVPIADVPAELVSMWFDDAYHPTSAQHIRAFSVRERDLLAAFHSVYERCVDALPSDGGVIALQQSPHWATVAQHAARTARGIRGAT